MAEIEIKEIATIWKNKKGVNNLYNPIFKHYGDPGYTEIEREFLKGIGFQLGISQLVPCIESLFRECELYRSNLNFASILSNINKYLDKVYFDSHIMFMYPGPKLALAIMTASLQLLIE